MQMAQQQLDYHKAAEAVWRGEVFHDQKAMTANDYSDYYYYGHYCQNYSKWLHKLLLHDL